MKYLQIIFIGLFAWQAGIAQGSGKIPDHLAHLVAGRQFASLHLALDSLTRMSDDSDAYCPLAENVFENYFFQRNSNIFYLRDSLRSDGDDDLTIAVQELPEQLEKLLAQYPQSACLNKVNGDYYALLLEEATKGKPENDRYLALLKDKVFQYYRQAADRGMNNVAVNRWLGIYYADIGKPGRAKTYLERIFKQGKNDAIASHFLSQIYFAEKQYSQCYNYAMKAIAGLPEAEREMRFAATYLAARSLRQLGESDQFVETVSDCIDLLPDHQKAYLDLASHYENRGETEMAETVMRRMFLANPYDVSGYQFLEAYSSRQGIFYFGESLLEDLLLRHELSDKVLGNIHYCRGNLLYRQGMFRAASQQWEISRSYYRKCLPDDSPILQQVGQLSRQTH